MATVLERIRLIARSEVAELRERYEDPEKVVNQTIADAMVAYTKLRQEAEPILATEAQARQRLDELTNEAERWHRVARKALAAGNEGDARTALSREVDLKDRIARQRTIFEQAHEVAQTFTQRVTEIADGINQLQAQAARIKAKESATQATSAAGRVSGGSGALDRLEEKADWKLAEAEGLAEAQREVLADPFEELARAEAARQASKPAASVDEALAALRAQLDDENEDDD